MPGGKLESGESDEEAAIREVKEELGISAKIKSEFVTIIEKSKSTGQTIRFKLFLGEMQELPDQNSLPGKTVSIAKINSNYKQEGIEVSNLAFKLIPFLVEKNLID